MNDNIPKIKWKWLERLKKIKHIEIYIALAFLLIILIIFSGNFTKPNISKSIDENTVSGYVTTLETRLEKILCEIKGVSNVSVMISLSTDDMSVEDSNLKMSNFPTIQGVLITASGADDVNTKMKILHAIETVIDINSRNIQIFSS